MKTTSYNAAKEIRIGILLVVFTLAVFTAFKVKELQVNDANNGELTRADRIAVNHTNFPTSPVLEAKLIEEPSLEVNAMMNNIEYNAQIFIEAEMAIESERFLNSNTEAVEAELALQIEALMKSTEYNADEFVEADMAIESERFLNSNNEAVEAELALQIETLMKNTEYNAKEFVEAEITLEIENWMNSSEYWNTASK